MTKEICFRASEAMLKDIKSHLLPDDGLEAAGILLCGVHQSESIKLLLGYQWFPIAYSECERYEDFLSWDTELLIPLIEKAKKENLALIKIHSHPGGYDQFSEQDLRSDFNLFTSLHGWFDSDLPHGSMIILPDGKLFGDVIDYKGERNSISQFQINGESISVYPLKANYNEEVGLRTKQLFGGQTTTLLSGLTIGVVGCSGTGSLVIEQLVRLGIKKLVLIDPDKIEMKNLNRIINSSYADAESGIEKTEMLRQKYADLGFPTEIVAHPVNLFESAEAIQDLISCNIVFGCVDSHEGRFLINQISTFYHLPYFDVGVKVEGDGVGGIETMMLSVHYIQPGFSSMRSRIGINMEKVRSEGLSRTDPVTYQADAERGYLSNVNVGSPAVISINMQAASIAVTEMLNRLHPFKISNYFPAKITHDLLDGKVYYENESEFENDISLGMFAGKGDTEPFLNLIGVDQPVKTAV